MIKWVGFFEIGVISYDFEKLDFFIIMINVQLFGIWMMLGGSIVCDGVIVIENYGLILDEIKVEMYWFLFFIVLICC